MHGLFFYWRRERTMKKLFVVLAAVLLLALISCGGGGGGGDDATPTPTTYSISGSVSGAVTAGVTITLAGQSDASRTTDDSGNYSFPSLANGSYTVTPSLAGYTFSPVNVAANVSGADVTGHNFVATGSGTTLNIVQIDNAASPVIAAVTDSKGKEKLALIGAKDSTGAPVSVTQSLYIAASGEAGTLQLG